MNIKNTVDLSISEAVELLAKIADSLEHSGEFAFDLKGQEVSIEAGEQLQAQLSISPDKFSMIFNWGEDVTSADEQPETEVVQEQPIEEAPQMTPEAESRVTPAQSTPRRALPDRMPLNTTTLPLEGGYWDPAFTDNSEVKWTPVAVEGELENKKWASEDQITTLSDLTPSSAQPKKTRPKKSTDDDLFSELDKLDEKTSVKSKSTTEKVEKVNIPESKSAKPAAAVGSIPQPKSQSNQNRTSSVRSSSPPSPKSSSSPPSPSKSKSSIPKPQQSTPPSPNADGSDWQEPKQEDNATNDNWVRPSEILKKRQNVPKAQQQESPSSGKKQTSKRSSIPKPGSAKESSKTQQSNEISNDVRDWKEPSTEDNTTNDDWVKPSEFLKKSKNKQEEDADPVNRPPPRAPDSDEKDKKKKGWASWD